MKISDFEKDKLILIIGLGMTGFSCARYFAGKARLLIVDSREQPPYLQALKDAGIDATCHFGDFEVDETILSNLEFALVSPGVDKKVPLIQKLYQSQIPVLGDVELFSRLATKPIIAITGSNGKSTVTEWVGEMFNTHAKISAGVGGNIGKPVLELLESDHQLFVLELSSFQLESVEQLQPRIAVVLNVSDDHMDRYASIEDYRQVKLSIYDRAETKIVNVSEDAGYEYQTDELISFSDSHQHPASSSHHLYFDEDAIYLDGTVFLERKQLTLQGRHNLLNALVVLAIGLSMDLSKHAIVSSLKSFKGLAHRCQVVRVLDGVTWINDSKATNVGACLAALKSLGDKTHENIVLIAGGDGKGGDFTALADSFRSHVKALVLIGKDANQLAKVANTQMDVTFATNLEEAVRLSKDKAKAGDIVLLSPACASTDMFKNFEQRGDVFVRQVEAIV